MKLNHFKQNYRILGQAPILTGQYTLASIADVRVDAVDLDFDGKCGAYKYLNNRRTTEPVFTVPYLKAQQFSELNGEEVITQDDFPRQQLATGKAEPGCISFEDQSPVGSLVDYVAPFASTEERAQAKWALDMTSDLLYFYLDQKPSEVESRSSFDFRSNHTILGEADILEQDFTSGLRSPIDIDGNGRPSTVFVGGSKHQDEPHLSTSLNKLKAIGETEQKEILVDRELTGLKLTNLAVDWRKPIPGKPVGEFLASIAPLATAEQTAKARWGIDLKRNKLFFFTEDTPPAEQRPSLAEKVKESVIDPARKKAQDVCNDLIKSPDGEKPGLLKRILSTTRGWLEALRQNVGF